ncbi:MAG: nucleoside phosphorylase [Bacillota bacterium]
MALQNPEHAYREYLPELREGERFSEHHIKVRREEVSRYLFIPGSHLRGRRIAEMLDGARVVSATRGYYLYSGTYQGIFMTVCSTGMGGPATAIAMEELARLGADTFIRVGSAGAVQEFLGVGDIAVATAAVRGGGTSHAYLPAIFPAAADFALTRAMVEAAERLGTRVHTGICATGDAFYAPDDPRERELLKRAGVLAIEMEADTAFTLAHYHGWRAGAAFVLDGGPARDILESSAAGIAIANHGTNPDFRRGEEALIRLCLEAMAEIARRDASSAAR